MSNVFDTSPASSAVAVTKSDTTEYVPPLRAVYVGTAGDIAILSPGTTTAVTFPNVQDGTILPVKASKVMSTNTTASDIVGMR